MLRRLLTALFGQPQAEMYGMCGTPRSGQWRRVQQEHLAKEPTCRVCGGKEDLNVHHLRPFEYFPELELEPKNLITLCNAKRCHITFGHGGDFHAWNPHCISDVTLANQMYRERKYSR